MNPTALSLWSRLIGIGIAMRRNKWSRSSECADKACLTRVERATTPMLFVGFTPTYVASANLIEVRVGPAHGGLDCQMQAIEPNRDWHLDAAQDLGLYIVEGDFETSDGGHAASLRWSFPVAQRQGRSAARSLIGWSAILASTSASQACGSTRLSFCGLNQRI